MPNGGSDCCGTCWFNRSNDGARGYAGRRGKRVPPHCEIRDEPIEDPFWTYCANHSFRRPEKDRIPIGPILVAGGLPDNPYHNPYYPDNPYYPYGRVVWKLSPDTEEIRQHLLALLAEFETTTADRRVVVWQLGEFREQRAVETMQRLVDELPEESAATVRQALKRIRNGVEQDLPMASPQLALERREPRRPPCTASRDDSEPRPDAVTATRRRRWLPRIFRWNR